MTREALRLTQVRQRSHFQSIALPLVVVVEIVTARQIRPKLVVRSESKRIVEDRRIDDRCCIPTQHTALVRRQLAHAEDDRSMARCLLIVDEDAVDLVAVRI